jgi:ribosomal protein S18 acetylase RimI-like enzyme
MSVVVEIVDRVGAEVVEAFGRLLPQLSSGAEPLDERALAAIVGCGTNRILVARDEDGRIVGTLTLVVFPVPSGVRARIEDVVVDERARGQGVAGELSRRALRIAEEAGARSVDLTSRPERAAANRLYERLGFVRRGSAVYRFAISEAGTEG